MRDASLAKILKARLWALSLLLAFPAGAADVVKPVDLSLAAPIAGEIRAVPGNLAVPGLQNPSVVPQLGEIPALPPSALDEAAPQSALATPGSIPLPGLEAAARERGLDPTVLASLQGIAQVQAGQLAPNYFDRQGKVYKAAVTSSFEGDSWGRGEEGPRRPRGVSSVSVDEVHGPADIYRLIPNGINSDGLKAKLVENVDTMAPYTIYTYRASRGGPFVGIDLSRNPGLVDVLPEQQSHEVKLIKKIQAYNKDLQVLVRETGKTPDLVVGGIVTELKSLIGDKVDLTYLVNKANNQVHEHAERHALGNGAAVVDLAHEKSFTPALELKIAKELDTWRRMPAGYELPGFYTGPRVKKQAIALDRIYLFAGSDLRTFVRHTDGSYRVAGPEEVPFAVVGKRPGIKKHQLFIGKQAYARPPPVDTTMGHAFDRMYLVQELHKLVAKGRVKAAFEMWSEFERESQPAEVSEARRRISDIWQDIIRGRKQKGGGSRRR
jgi:hypothetical protein